MPKFTPTETRILAVLSDGMPHRRDELMRCLWDELSSRAALKMQLSNIRAKLRPIGQDIVCEWYNRGLSYRQIRLLASAVDGRR